MKHTTREEKSGFLGRSVTYDVFTEKSTCPQCGNKGESKQICKQGEAQNAHDEFHCSHCGYYVEGQCRGYVNQKCPHCKNNRMTLYIEYVSSGFSSPFLECSSCSFKKEGVPRDIVANWVNCRSEYLSGFR